MNNLEKELPKEIPTPTGLTFQEIEFLHNCDIYPTYDRGELNAITVILENEKGGLLTKQDIKMLIAILTKYVQA